MHLTKKSKNKQTQISSFCDWFTYYKKSAKDLQNVLSFPGLLLKMLWNQAASVNPWPNPIDFPLMRNLRTGLRWGFHFIFSRVCPLYQHVPLETQDRYISVPERWYHHQTSRTDRDPPKAAEAETEAIVALVTIVVSVVHLLKVAL